MTKKQIPVNGDKELIEKLNSRIKEIKSEKEPETVAAPEVEGPVEEIVEVEYFPTMADYIDKNNETPLIPTEVCDLVETVNSGKKPAEEKPFDEVESDLQRNIKYRKDYRKTPKNEVHAVAYPSVAEMKGQSEEVKAMLNIFGPKMVELLSRINDAADDTTLEDNKACRKTVEEEYHTLSPFEESEKTQPSDEFKKILQTSKELVKYLKGINIDGVNGRNIRDAINRAKSKTVKDACEFVASQQTEPEQREPETTDVPQDEKYEMVDHPSHYNNYDKEVIDIIEVIWGTQLAAVWCEITAFKYRMRMGTKPTSPISEDLKKETWYLKKMKELRTKHNEGNGIIPKI